MNSYWIFINFDIKSINLQISPKFATKHDYYYNDILDCLFSNLLLFEKSLCWKDPFFEEKLGLVTK